MISDLIRLWDSIPRSKEVSESHRKISHRRIRRFIEYCEKQHPKITKLDHVAAEHAQGFMDEQLKRRVSPRTWNATLGTLKAACRRGKCTAFDELKQKPLETVHRIPYTPEELVAIFAQARRDPLLYPLVITAATTANRHTDIHYQ